MNELNELIDRLETLCAELRQMNSDLAKHQADLTRYRRDLNLPLSPKEVPQTTSPKSEMPGERGNLHA